MKVNPYLIFNGRCEEAMKFYGEAIGAKTEIVMPYEGSPASAMTPTNWQKKIMHAAMKFGDSTIMMSDGRAEGNARPQGITITLHTDTPDEAKRVFNALADKGSVTMPLDKTFFAEAFGMLTDRFDIPWMIICQ